MLAGTLSMAGSGSSAGLVRNLDRSGAAQEGLNLPDSVFLSTFPLGDSAGQRLTSGCNYPSLTTREKLLDENASLLHVAQGIDSSAANEARCLTAIDESGEDLALPTTTFVDAIALQPDVLAHLGAAGSGVVWSPRMHLRLYGATTPVTVAARSGVKVGLGTGTIALGSENMLRELDCANTYNQNYLDNFFTPQQLWKMGTGTNSDLAGASGLIGRIEVDAFADLVVFAKGDLDSHRAVIEAAPEDLALVLRAGKPLYGDALLIPALTGASCDTLDICGRPKRVCLSDEIGTDLETLRSEVGEGAYPLAVCTPADDEPTCVPARANSINGSTTYNGNRTEQDPDGDGLLGEDDLCPAVFDPILPYHDGKPGDADEDELGDACDPCPLGEVCP